MSPSDPFPASDFDPWAATYDRDVVTLNRFPFDGYGRVLEAVMELAAPQLGMSILDLGAGTGNLAVRFMRSGCEVWCSDFSKAMLEKAREKLPGAHFVLHDLRAPMPASLQRRFDRIVSAYVFHHLALEQKVKLCRELATRHLTPGGRLVIADLSFQDREAMLAFAESVAELWEEEPYWTADQAMPALQGAGLKAAYRQVSGCAGVYTISP